MALPFQVKSEAGINGIEGVVYDFHTASFFIVILVRHPSVSLSLCVSLLYLYPSISPFCISIILQYPSLIASLNVSPLYQYPSTSPFSISILLCFSSVSVSFYGTHVLSVSLYVSFLYHYPEGRHRRILIQKGDLQGYCYRIVT